MINFLKGLGRDTNTKLRIFNSSVKSLLLYGAETWCAIKTTAKQVQSFISRCLHRIIQIWWPNHIRNQDHWECTDQVPPLLQVSKENGPGLGILYGKTKETSLSKTCDATLKETEREGDSQPPAAEACSKQ